MDDISSQITLGRYHLLSMLGKGGMGEVWLAEDPLLRRQVAIKRLLQYNQDDDEYLVRFEREARAAAALHHPHILPLHDYGHQQLPDGQVVPYIVMSYVAGGSVEERIVSAERQDALLPLVEAFAYLSQAAQAIDYAHAQGVFHRDIKPANMLLREDRNLLLTDFGLARLASDSGDLTHKSMVLGTPKYMAPEQARGGAVAASDIYSLAVIAYRLFTGQTPFNGETAYAMIAQHIVATPPSPRQFNPALSPAFEEALLSGLAKDQAQRPASAMAYVTQLRQAMTTPLASGDLTPQPSAPARPASISRRKVLIGTGAGVLVVGGGLAAITLSPLHAALFPAQVAPSGARSPKAAAPTGVPNGDAPMMQIQAVLNEPASQLAWSPVTNTLVALGSDDQVVLWKIQTGQTGVPTPLARHTFSRGGRSTDMSLAWSPDGDMLALRNIDTTLATLVYKSDLSGFAPGFSPASMAFQDTSIGGGICWTPGKYIFLLRDVYSSSSNQTQSTLHIYNPSQPQRPFQPIIINLQAGDSVNETLPMALSPASSALAIGGKSNDDTNGITYGVLVGNINITATEAHWQPYPLLQTDQNPVALAWSPDSRYLAAAAPTDYEHVLNVWDATRQYQPLKPALDLSNVKGKPTAVAWSPDAKNSQLAVGTQAGGVYLWNISASTAPVRTLSGIAGGVTALGWSHDGQWLAASYDDAAASILVWKIGDTHG